MDEPETPAERGDNEGHAAPESTATASVVLATFENSRAAERTAASLGREFRHKALKGSVARSWSPATATVRSSSSNPVW